MSDAAEIYIDGASRGNPGEAAYGVVARRNGRIVEMAEYLGKATNNEAEYRGLIAALVWAVDEGLRRVEIYSDSQLVVNQILGSYRVKADNFKPLFHRSLDLNRKIPYFHVHYIPRSRNPRADALANS